MTLGPRHRKRSWCLLAGILAGVAVLIVVGIYAMMRSEAPPRGAQGPLLQSAPRSDPAPVFMQPGTRPER